MEELITCKIRVKLQPETQKEIFSEYAKNFTSQDDAAESLGVKKGHFSDLKNYKIKNVPLSLLAKVTERTRHNIEEIVDEPIPEGLMESDFLRNGISKADFAERLEDYLSENPGKTEDELSEIFFAEPNQIRKVLYSYPSTFNGLSQKHPKRCSKWSVKSPRQTPRKRHLSRNASSSLY